MAKKKSKDKALQARCVLCSKKFQLKSLSDINICAECTGPIIEKHRSQHLVQNYLDHNTTIAPAGRKWIQ